MTDNDRDKNGNLADEVTSDDFITIEETDGATGESVSETDIVGEESHPDPSPAESYTEIEELGEETSVIDAGFAAPPVEDTPPDVLEARSPANVTEEVVEIETQEIGEDVTSTGVMRRSLFDSTAQVDETVVETEPAQPVAAPQEYGMDAALLEGATIMPEVPSRQPSRWLSAIAFLFLTPIAWYLLADAGGRLLIAADAPWISGLINPAAIGELIGGLAVLVILAVVALQSSLGMYISGVLLAIGGLPFLLFPTQTQAYLDGPIGNFLLKLGPMGENIAFYLVFTGATGLFFVTGVGMILTGWVVTRVRRKGRAEESLRVEVAEVNPDGLNARWARKATTTD